MQYAIIALLVASAAAQSGLESLITNEVNNIMQDGPLLTVDQCTTKCDAEFSMMTDDDEALTDRLCHDACDRHINGGGSNTDPLHEIVRQEVTQIISDNTGITVDNCSTKCDALFELISGHDESVTDQLCHDECRSQISGGQNGRK